jgi:hypothetical protein
MPIGNVGVTGSDDKAVEHGGGREELIGFAV